MYDVFILGLMIVGITSLVVFSYKIFHSRVYPVGIVRRVPAAQELVDEASAESSGFGAGLEADLMDYLARDWSNIEIARDLNLSEQDVKKHLQRVTWALHAKRRSGLKSGKQQYKLALLHYWAQKQPHEPETEDPALEKEVIEHGEALKLHSKQLEELEKKMRRLEIKSVQELQEAEEKPQPPLVVQ